MTLLAFPVNRRISRPFLGQWNSAHVFRIDENETARRVPVRLGAASLSRVEILEGLAPGDRVVVSGVEAFGDAERVILSR